MYPVTLQLFLCPSAIFDTKARPRALAERRARTQHMSHSSHRLGCAITDDATALVDLGVALISKLSSRTLSNFPCVNLLDAL